MPRIVLRFLAALRRLHERLTPLLDVPRDRVPLWAFGLLLLGITALGAVVRARVVFDGLGPDDSWLGQPLLTSADGFYFASGVGNAVTDDWGIRPRVARLDEHALVGIGALLVKVFGFQREAIFTWLPVLIGPLIAVPLAFIGRAYSRSVVGLGAALVAVVAPGYLVRTAAAYFDTDLFAVTVPLVAVLFLTRLLRAEERDHEGRLPAPSLPGVARRDALWVSLTLAAYLYFYDQGGPLTLLLHGVAALGLLTVALLERAEVDRAQRRPALLGAPEAARHALLIAISTAPIYWAIRSGAVMLASFALARFVVRPKVLLLAAVLATLVVFATGPAMRHLVNKLQTYSEAAPPAEVRPGEPTASATGSSAQVPHSSWAKHDTTGIVAEAHVLPFGSMTGLLSGSSPLALLGFLGFLLVLLWRPSLVAIVPLAAIGLFGFIGGHRFLIYLVPAVALGVAYLAARLTRWLPRRLHLGATALLTIGASVPALAGLRSDEVQVALNASEAEALVAIDARAETTDTTISWWDFGYAIKYFAKTRTLNDGSRRGDDASLMAEIMLTHSPELANRLAHLAADANAQDPIAGAAKVLFDAAKARGLGPEAFLAEAEAGVFQAPRHSGDVYLFLTRRLIPILPVLEATRPRAADSVRAASYLHTYRGVRSEGAVLYLEDGIEVDANAVQMRRPNRRGGSDVKSLREVHVLGGTGATMYKNVRLGNPDALTAGVLLRDLGMFIELDARILESQWAQIYLFENADPRYYEPVHITATTKVYRFK